MPLTAEDMEEDRRVDMVRIPREEEIYDREEVLGRDTASVFPSEAKKAAADSLEALKEAIGAKKFISETEVGVLIGYARKGAFWHGWRQRRARRPLIINTPFPVIGCVRMTLRYSRRRWLMSASVGAGTCPKHTLWQSLDFCSNPPNCAAGGSEEEAWWC